MKRIDHSRTLRTRVCSTVTAVLLAAGVMEVGEASAGERILHFPADRSLGKLHILDTGIKRQIVDFFYWINGTEMKWIYVGEAQGDVTIPSGQRVRLTVGKTACSDLSPLAGLGPDDLDELSLAYTPADDRCMPFIGHLTGLRVLDLQSSEVSDVGLRRLLGMKSLERLHIPPRLTDAGMVHIGQLRSLKALYFKGNRVSDAGLSHLAGLRALEELELGGKVMSPQGNPLPSLMTNDGLTNLAKLPRLWYLILWGDYTGPGLAHLKDIPSLRTLNLGALRIANDDLRYLSALTNLEALDLYGTKATDEGLAHLKPIRSLRKLCLRQRVGGVDPKHPPFTDRGMEALKEIKTLEYLSLSADGISDRGLTALAQLDRLKHLELPMASHIDPKTYRNPYTEHSLKELVKIQGLEELEITGPGITDAALSHLTRLTNLHSLMLFGCPISNDGLVTLGTLKSLHSLTLPGPAKAAAITLSGLNRLNGLANLTRLEARMLKHDSGTLDIAGLTRLEYLILSCAPGAGVRDDDLACLEHLKQLKWLHVSGLGPPSPITDAGMAHLAGLTALENLGIEGRDVTDRGLAIASRLPRLEYLWITGSFTDQGLRDLESLKGLHSLRIRSGNSISPAAKQRLRQSLSHASIFAVEEDPSLRGVPKPGHPQPGTPAPDFTVTTLDGTKFQLSQQRGKVVLLHFWGTWCAPCVASLPKLKEYHDVLRQKYGESVVTLNLAMDHTDAKVRALIQSRKWSGPHACIGLHSTLAASYGVTGAPDDFLIGPDGRVLLNRESPEGPDDTEAVIDNALGRK